MTFPGHLRAKDILPRQALALLLRLYNDYEPFLRHCEEVKPELERLHSSRLEFARERELVWMLARRWNLDRIPEITEFNCRRLREGIRQTGNKVGTVTMGPFFPMFFFEFIPEHPRLTYGGRVWEWMLHSDESLGEFRKRVMRDLGLKRSSYLPDEIVHQLDAMPAEAKKLNWQLADMQHGLRRTVDWLFLRLCPQPEAPLSFARIAELEVRRRGWDTEPEALIRRAVVRLVRLMSIQLPPLKRGRPRVKLLLPSRNTPAQ